MSNIEKLLESKNKNHRLFGLTVVDLKDSQGFYSGLYSNVNEMCEDNFEQLYCMLEKQNFKDPLDVILWLEC